MAMRLRLAASGLCVTMVITVSALLLTACKTIKMPLLPEQQSATFGQSQVKMPLSVALVVTDETKLQRITVNRSVYQVHPDATVFLAKQLETVFREVRVVEEPFLGQHDGFQYLFYPEITARQDYALLHLVLGWRIVHAGNGQAVAAFSTESSLTAEKSLLEKLTGRSFDPLAATDNHELFTGSLAQAVHSSIPIIRKATHQHQKAVTVASSSVMQAKTGDTIPPVLVITTPERTRSLFRHEKSSPLYVQGYATDESGVAEVTIDGISVPVDGQGNFRGDVVLQQGKPELVIVATDRYANRTFVRIPVTEKPDTVDMGQTGKKLAVLIGVNRYQHLGHLKTAVHDVRKVAEVLAHNYGYETRVLLDEKASHDGIMRTLNQIRTVVKPDDQVLIYYAGHGILEQETDASYWLPVDADPKDDTKWIDTKRISDQFKRITARQVLVVADSCYSGTMSRNIAPALSRGEVRDSFLKKIQSRPSRVLIASGGNEPVADSGGGEHSVFASVFIQSLSHPPMKVFTASELLTTVIREAVAGRSAQTPEHKVIRNSGHESGDFVFEKIK